jgi:hypothetical protein
MHRMQILDLIRDARKHSGMYLPTSKDSDYISFNTWVGFILGLLVSSPWAEGQTKFSEFVSNKLGTAPNLIWWAPFGNTEKMLDALEEFLAGDED